MSDSDSAIVLPSNASSAGSSSPRGSKSASIPSSVTVTDSEDSDAPVIVIPLPQPPPPPPRCDDFNHCHPPGVNSCPVSIYPCPGLATNHHPTPRSYAGIDHPWPHHSFICNQCTRHGDQHKVTTISVVANTAQRSGSKVFLCKRCMRDEIKLYWERYLTAKPSGPAAAPSLRNISRWPWGPAPNDLQNLCYCYRKSYV